VPCFQAQFDKEIKELQETAEMATLDKEMGEERCTDLELQLEEAKVSLEGEPKYLTRLFQQFSDVPNKHSHWYMAVASWSSFHRGSIGIGTIES
jgi:hypothetical protein